MNFIDQHLVMIFVFVINKILKLEVLVILVILITYQMDTHMLEIQEIFYLEILINGQQLKSKSSKLFK